MRTTLLEVVCQGEESAQVWNKIVDICSGLIALHKCTWQLIAWAQTQGYMALVQDPGTTLTLCNTRNPNSNTVSPPTQAKCGIGFLDMS
jgi:hypothetical protein